MYVAIAVDDVLMIFDVDTMDKREAVIKALQNHPYRDGLYAQQIKEAVIAFSEGKGNSDVRESGILAKTLDTQTKGYVTATLNYADFRNIEMRVISDKPDEYEACFESLRISKADNLDVMRKYWNDTKDEIETSFFDPPTFEDFELAILDCGWLVTQIPNL